MFLRSVAGTLPGFLPPVPVAPAKGRCVRRAAGTDEEAELRELRFRGVALLLGATALRRLQRAHAAVLGLGGVGSWVVEALARSGLGGLTLVDMDDICISNTNRQLHTLGQTVGRPKAEVLAERVREINPDCVVDVVQDFFVSETESLILDRRRFDVVVDAIDGVANKCQLIHGCRTRQIPVVVSGGLGGKVDPTLFREEDMTRVEGDGLTRRVRNTLRQRYGYPAGSRKKKKWGIPVVFSPEPPQFYGPTASQAPKGRKTCDTSYGTFCPAAGAQGFALAAAALRFGPQLERLQGLGRGGEYLCSNCSSLYEGSRPPEFQNFKGSGG
ncbi:tcdA [Symbiodinium natans]|uniref:TcdA protein n=1 Tax=Symbiodinium natans TaxID=878477 RepID=A0A812P1H2_9DINO|nr:tcdA [Symbiodinium natans]